MELNRGFAAIEAHQAYRSQIDLYWTEEVGIEFMAFVFWFVPRELIASSLTHPQSCQTKGRLSAR